ncbi:MAG: ATP-dependent helicase [Nocardioidaceae bacterium]
MSGLGIRDRSGTGEEPDQGAGLPVLLSDRRRLCEVLDTPFSGEQLDAITADVGPGVIVAGAGSGKTTVMAARVVWLVGTGQVSPDRVLGLTFTNKGAAELGTRVRRALERLVLQSGDPRLVDELGEPTVATYHAYAGSLIGEHGLRLGIEPDLRVVSDASRFQLAARVVARHAARESSLSTSLAVVVQGVLTLDAQMSDHLVEPETLAEFDLGFLAEMEAVPLRHGKVRAPVAEAMRASRSRQQLLDLVQRYRAAKLEAGVAEFSDQMARGARLAIECPEVGTGERTRFDVVLLDEYQDTSVAQRRMLQGLFSGPDPDTGLGHAVTAVGDPCQAIYGWRGASVDNLDDFCRHFPGRDRGAARQFRLSVNRRCSVRVLDGANHLAEPLLAVHGAAAPSRPRPNAPDGSLAVALHETVVDEIDWLADQVVAAHATHLRADPAASWSDIAILIRDGKERGALSTALRARDVPVEALGLPGLLSQPEVGEVLATLRVIHDLTDNPALLRLLTGPRWRIGVRDLARLGERARGLVAVDAWRSAEGLSDTLEAAVSGIDPADITSLCDALDDPGRLAYSFQARQRFAALSAELRGLRRHVGEPLSELVRRVIDVLGIDVELAAMPGPAAEQAQDNLALLIDAVADYSAGDDFASLPGLLAYLDAETRYNAGMKVAEPRAANAVKLLTIHTAKGLEWRTVFLPFWSDGVFPSGQARPRWQFASSELPSPLRGDAESLPLLQGWTGKHLDRYAAALRERTLLEERRLAYVAMTRAKFGAVVSGHHWGRTQTKPRGLSPYLATVHACAGAGEADPWIGAPHPDAANPVIAAAQPVAFPASLDQGVVARRRRVAAAVRRALDAPSYDLGITGAAVRDVAALPGDDRVGGAGVPEGEDAAEADDPALARLDEEIDLLIAEASRSAADVVEIDLPAALSATALLRLRSDPAALARELARPMPRRPVPSARFGTRFHAWVEAYFGQQTLLDPTDLPGRADPDIDDDAELAVLTEAFRDGPYGERVPTAVEAPFQLVLAGQVVRGRIDAVYARPDGGCEVVDWKTGTQSDADPTQLAIYRLAWAEMYDLPLDRVSAAFYFVRTGDVVRPEPLADRAELEAVIPDPAEAETGWRAAPGPSPRRSRPEPGA